MRTMIAATSAASASETESEPVSENQWMFLPSAMSMYRSQRDE